MYEKPFPMRLYYEIKDMLPSGTMKETAKSLFLLEKNHFEIGNPVDTVNGLVKSTLITFEFVLKLKFILYFYRLIITKNSYTQFM